MSNTCSNKKDCVNNNILLKELINNQLKSTPLNKKLTYSDFKRIIKYIDVSLFDDNKCCLWNGYITNSKPEKNYKGAYINFYFKKKKVALHRLLFINFKEHISDNDYIKYTCDNKGGCCNINHMVKFTYNSILPSQLTCKEVKQNTKNDKNEKSKILDEINSENEEDFVLGFK